MYESESEREREREFPSSSVVRESIRAAREREGIKLEKKAKRPKEKERKVFDDNVDGRSTQNL